jgi:UvrD-like helicase C-terminal domain/AAA domain
MSQREEFVLTDEQFRCINEVDRVHHAVIPATSGSGKSTIIPKLIEKILSLDVNQHLGYNNILLVTFSILAAENLEQKLRHPIWLSGTFHAVAAKILIHYKIFSLEELYLLSKNEYLTELLKFLRSDREESIICRASIAYGLIDEFQDLDRTMYDILLILKDSGTRFYVVGQDWQAIYSWRSSELEFIQKFQYDFVPCRVYPLSVNFRCPAAIVRLSNQIMYNGDINSYMATVPAISKEEWLVRREGGLDFVIDPLTLPRLFHSYNLETAISQMCQEILHRKQRDRTFEYNDVFILTRNNKTIQQIRNKMISLDIPCYNVKDNLKRRKKGSSDIRTYYSKQKLGLLTVHSAKGLEKKHIYLCWLEDGSFPDYRVMTEEERRVLYVGVTRSKKTLTIWNSSSRPSLFIQEFYRAGVHMQYFQTHTHQISLNKSTKSPSYYHHPSSSSSSSSPKVKQSEVIDLTIDDDDDEKEKEKLDDDMAEDEEEDEEEETKNEEWEKMILCDKMEEQILAVHSWISENAKNDHYIFDKRRFSSKHVVIRKIENSSSSLSSLENDDVHSPFIYENDLDHIVVDTFECFLHRYLVRGRTSCLSKDKKIIFPFADKYTLKSLEKKLNNIPLALLDKILLHHYKDRYQDPTIGTDESLLDCYWTSVFLSVLTKDIFHIHLEMNSEYLKPYLPVFHQKIGYLHTCFPSLSLWKYHPSPSNNKTHLPSYLVSPEQTSILFLCGRYEEDIQIHHPFQLIVYFVAMVALWNLKQKHTYISIIYWYLFESSQLMQITLVAEDWRKIDFLHKFLKSLM